MKQFKRNQTWLLGIFLFSIVLGMSGCADDGQDGLDGSPGLDGAPGADGTNAQQIGTIGSGPVVISGIDNNTPQESIYVRKVGNGDQSIVLIPGNNSSSTIFEGLLNLFRAVDKLNDTYTVYAFDYRGSGQSSFNTKISSLADFAYDFEEVMQTIDDFPSEDVTLVGYSMGFAVGLEMVINNPSRYSKLVGLAPVGTRGVRVQFNAASQGTDENGNIWMPGDVVPIDDDPSGIVATAFQQRSWQGVNRTFANVQFTWDLVVFNDILKINPADFSAGSVLFRSEPIYESTLADVLKVQYMPESLYYTHKFNVSPLDGGTFPNSDGSTVVIHGNNRLANMLVGKEVLLLKAKTDFLNWRGDLVITDNVISSSKYDLKQAGATTQAILVAPDQGYDHGLALTKPSQIANIIDAFIQGQLTEEAAAQLLEASIEWYDNDETEFESAEF